MMKLGIMQPYFMPYIGYFQLIKAVDEYVVYDDVNYIKGGWINRNNILVNGEKKLFTIILRGASPYKLINEIEIGDDFKKFLKTIQLSYSKAAYFDEVIILIEKIISFNNKNLSDFTANSILEIINFLDIKTKVHISSNLEKNISLKGKDKVINICEKLGATSYYNAIGGQALYEKIEFKAHGIDLFFLKSEIETYNQYNNCYIPNLSIIDVLMHNSKKETNRLLDCYSII